MIEMMAAMGIIFLVLGLAGALVTDYSRVLRRAAPRERLLEVVELGSERVASELSGALEVTTPGAGTTSTLTFDRIDPSADRLPPPPPAPVPFWWDFRDPDHILVVTYSVVNKELIRDTASVTTNAREVLCQGLSGMSATRVNNRCFRITFSVEVEGYLQDVVKEVTLWVDP